MPFKFDDSKAVKKSDVVLLFQDSFINRYSKKRKTPIFTSQRLDGKALKLLKKNVKNKLYYFALHYHTCRVNCQIEMKQNGSELSVG